MKRRYGEKGLVRFVVGGIYCALDIERIEEIVRPLRLSPLVSSSALVLGMADYRGRVVPVVDLSLGLSRDAWQPTRGARWIVGRGMGKVVALAVDSVEGVSTSDVAWEAGEYPVDHKQDLVAGVARVEGDLILLVDLDRLIREHLGTKSARQLRAPQDRERS